MHTSIPSSYFNYLTYVTFALTSLSPSSSSSSSLSSPESLLPSPQRSTGRDHTTSSSRLLAMHDDDVALFNHFKVAYTQRIRGQLELSTDEMTTSSISVKWKLSSRMFNDSTIESTVICETVYGLIVSRKIMSTASSGSHRVEGLQSNTAYIMCVYMLENSTKANLTVLHFSCHKSETIPVLRNDSIVGVILTFGYVFLMAAIGYIVWRRKYNALQEDRVRITVHEDDDDDDDDDNQESARNNTSNNVSGRQIEPRGYDNNLARRPHTTGKIITRQDTSNSNSQPRRSSVERKLLSAKPKAKAEVDGADYAVSEDGGEANGGCLDFRKSRDSSSMLCGASNTEMTDKIPLSKRNSRADLESSPIKVTEISF